jgi:hypothetical protein
MVHSQFSFPSCSLGVHTQHEGVCPSLRGEDQHGPSKKHVSACRPSRLGTRIPPRYTVRPVVEMKRCPGRDAIDPCCDLLSYADFVPDIHFTYCPLVSSLILSISSRAQAPVHQLATASGARNHQLSIEM